MQTVAPEPAARTKQRFQYCVISHTHWDREWYQPFEVFRLRLVDLIDHVLEILAAAPTYRFHLDAQTIILEDYLDVRPGRREELIAHITAGNLIVGPWYVHNDFFLTSGEATIRNLLLGTAIANEYGHCSRIGYVPDQFGLISQLPQVLNGFGIQNCIFGRGFRKLAIDAEGKAAPVPTDNEFTWRGADGSQVLTIHLSNWYNNAQRFPDQPSVALKYLRMIEKRVRPRSRTPYLLLMNGVDHLEAQEDLLPILESINSQLGEDGGHVYQTTLDEYVEKVGESLAGQQLSEHAGEMRQGADAEILQGTLSSRGYLKRANARLQSLLENTLEPLYTLLGLTAGEACYPADTLRHLWKRLIQNHPHDSICGCSCDPVHAHMEDRFRSLNEAGTDLLRRGMAELVRRLDRSGISPEAYLLLVCNTVKTPRGGAITATLHLPAEDAIERIELLDAEGRAVPFEILACEPRLISLFSPINLPGHIEVKAVTIQFVPEPLPGLSWRHYIVQPGRPAGVPLVAAAQPAAPANGPHVLENETLRVEVQATGQVDLLEKATGLWTRDLLHLVDETDLGHSYNFIPDASQSPSIISAQPCTITTGAVTPFAQSVRLEWNAELGECFDRAQRRRSARTRSNPIELTLTLTQGVPWLEVTGTIENRTRDHRLRLRVHTDIQSEVTISSSPFDLIERDRRDPHTTLRVDSSQPTSGLVLVQDAQRGLALFTEGLYEYGHMIEPRGSLDVTLLRANGAIHHDALGLSAEGNAHLDPPVEWLVPDNQCLRTVEFRLGILPTTGTAQPAATLLDVQQQFAAPLLVHFDAVDTHKFTGGRPFVQDSDVDGLFYRDLPREACSLPLAMQPLCVAGEGIVLSALKQADAGTGWVARLYNPWPTARPATVRFACSVEHACTMRLDEQEQRPLALRDHAVELLLQPRQIVTLGFR